MRRSQAVLVTRCRRSSPSAIAAGGRGDADGGRRADCYVAWLQVSTPATIVAGSSRLCLRCSRAPRPGSDRRFDGERAHPGRRNNPRCRAAFVRRRRQTVPTAVHGAVGRTGLFCQLGEAVDVVALVVVNDVLNFGHGFGGLDGRIVEEQPRIGRRRGDCRTVRGFVRAALVCRRPARV